MKLERLVKLERRLAGWFDRSLRRSGAAPPDPIELVPMILDHVEEHVQPTAGGGRVFPYDRVTLQVRVPPERAAAFRAVFDDVATLERRIRGRLKDVGCVPPVALAVVAKLVAGPPPEGWGEWPFRIDYRARKAAATAAEPAVTAVRLAILAGDAGGRHHVFERDRINIGRMRRVAAGPQGGTRQNHLAFADGAGEVNATVSRAHAHIRRDRETGEFRLFDDGSVHGTRVLRDGRSLAVPKRGSRGLRLEHGDEIELGAARVRFLTRWPQRSEASPDDAPPRRRARR
jgi:hypothetical protein